MKADPRENLEAQLIAARRKRQPGVNQRQMRTFAELEFVPKGENIVFIGPTGVGKTGLASGLLLKALQNARRGRRASSNADRLAATS